MQTFLLQIMQTFDYRFNYDFRWDDTWEYSKMTSRTSSGTFADVGERRFCVGWNHWANQSHAYLKI